MHLWYFLMQETSYTLKQMKIETEKKDKESKKVNKLN